MTNQEITSGTIREIGKYVRSGKRAIMLWNPIKGSMRFTWVPNGKTVDYPLQYTSVLRFHDREGCYIVSDFGDHKHFNTTRQAVEYFCQRENRIEVCNHSELLELI